MNPILKVIEEKEKEFEYLFVGRFPKSPHGDLLDLKSFHRQTRNALLSALLKEVGEDEKHRRSIDKSITLGENIAFEDGINQERSRIRTLIEGARR